MLITQIVFLACDSRNSCECDLVKNLISVQLATVHGDCIVAVTPGQVCDIVVGLVHTAVASIACVY